MNNGVETQKVILKDGLEKFYREGIELNKGFELNEEWVNNNIEGIKKICNIFTVYPDVFLQLITPVDSNFQLYFYQRIFLRACMRYRYFYCCAPRAFSKSFLSIIAMFLRCIFLPGKLFIAPIISNNYRKIA